jgi:tripartite ATP-independent transporter DctP family solute receptor
MKPSRNFLVSVIGSFLLLLSLSPDFAHAAEALKLKFGHVLTPTHYYHKAAVSFANRVSKYSKGRIQVDVYPSGQLGSERDSLEGLRIGTVQITIVNMAVLNQFIPEFVAFQLPYLIKDYDHGIRVWNQVMSQKLSVKMDKAGFHLLGFLKASPRGIQSSRPIMKLADIQGMRIRTMEAKVFIEAYKALGAIPTPIPFPELVSALQAGVVDGADQGFSAFLSGKSYQVSPYFAHIEISQTLSPLIISQIVWKKLPKELKEATEKSAEESLQEQVQMYEEEIRKYEKAAKESQFPFAYTYPDLKEFREAVKPAYAKFERDLGKEVIDKIISLK